MLRNSHIYAIANVDIVVVILHNNVMACKQDLQLIMAAKVGRKGNHSPCSLIRR